MSAGRAVASAAQDGRVLRRFDPGRDIPAVVELLETAFGPDMLERDRQWLVELARLSDFTGPWIGVLTRLAPPLAMSLSGYVVEDGGQVVANASVLRAKSGVWVIANVVTRPDCRRQGLARQLMQEAIGAARQEGARQVHLQVRDDNLPARRLYDSLGFQRTGAMTWLLAPRLASVVLPVADLDSYHVVRWGRRQAEAARQVIHRADPAGLATAKILNESARGDLAAYLSSWMADDARYRFAASSGRTLHAVGVAWSAAAPGPHQLSMAVEPQWRGRVEAGLAAALLAALRRHADVGVEAELDAEENHAVAVLEAAGFQRRRTLDHLVLYLNTR